jgi:hypothetical protein
MLSNKRLYHIAEKIQIVEKIREKQGSEEKTIQEIINELGYTIKPHTYYNWVSKIDLYYRIPVQKRFMLRASKNVPVKVIYIVFFDQKILIILIYCQT